MDFSLTTEQRQLVDTARAFAAAALAILAAVDFVLAKRRIWNQMKMTPDELKREYKDQEGDPHVRANRKRRARELANRRHAQLVPTADVVLVNPTEYAVAIAYDAQEYCSFSFI